MPMNPAWRRQIKPRMRSPRGHARPAPRVPEKIVQQQIVQILRTIGAAVYVLGTHRRRGDHPGTMQTPGLPDLYAFLPRRADRPCALWIEVKAAAGRLRLEQRLFAVECANRGIPHVVGGVNDVVAWLVAHGFLLADQVPHYRLPTAGQEA